MKPEIEYVYNKLKRLRFDFNSSDFRDFRSYYRYDPELMRYVRKDDNDLFIAKEAFKPLEEELEYADKCHGLEEQLGCPLEVIFKALKQDYIYTKSGKHSRIEFGTYGFEWCICYGLRTQIRVADYKKTWWLKEDKSE